ncbi:hypothetical protein KB879_24510 [Cupriavidus sp. KK10]|jgi:hypothetical protein|uniref:hypothetical protein n=1 Tax=Cupriavidus sp. KK10 TaxID=1478019 RepID=UPI001BA4A744|nr:hypothetical protein [Cupriavidus sp. KK10]QUN27219.1 hypothetical protein KB879_24510 [Cupriavidus sp. KK10]
MDRASKGPADMGHSAASASDGELIQRLRGRALDCSQKSMTARLAAVTDEVEALLARGYDRSQVRDVLVEAGWRFTPDSFDSALTRVRKRRSANGSRASGGGKPGPSANVENAVLPDTAAPRSHSGDGAFSDAFVGQEGLVSRRRWK